MLLTLGGLCGPVTVTPEGCNPKARAPTQITNICRAPPHWRTCASPPSRAGTPGACSLTTRASVDIMDKSEAVLASVGLSGKSDELAVNLSHGEQRNLETRDRACHRADGRAARVTTRGASPVFGRAHDGTTAGAEQFHRLPARRKIRVAFDPPRGRRGILEWVRS